MNAGWGADGASATVVRPRRSRWANAFRGGGNRLGTGEGSADPPAAAVDPDIPRVGSSLPPGGFRLAPPRAGPGHRSGLPGRCRR